MPPASEVIACVCLVWYVFIVVVCTIGCVQIFRRYSHAPSSSVSISLPADEIPHVTVVRPCKGKEPHLFDCLASSLEQDYPRDKLTVYFCVASHDDAACHVIEKVIAQYSQYDARLLVEEEDPALSAEAQSAQRLGPNPKIRNMSRAYREAKGDLVWILDCNIWVTRGVCGRMVDRLCGYSEQGPQRPYKFVHQLPVAVDVPPEEAFKDWASRGSPLSTPIALTDLPNGTTQRFGGRLDEAFLSSAHAKMYVAINTVAVAPCICGKSSMFRRSHLNALTNEDHSTETKFGSGIDFFSENICEDHLIGDLLWKAKIPSTMPAAAGQWRNHGLLYGDIAFQPESDMPVSSYIARRVRWLRVRKFTVPLATLVEPGTESFLCSLIGVYGLTQSTFTNDYFGSTWRAMIILWLLSISGWIAVDWVVYCLLQSGKTVEISPGDAAVPIFARALQRRPRRSRRSFLAWLMSWLSREALTLPVWTWATWGGVTVVWRDKKLWVGLDMRVHEIDDGKDDEQQQPLLPGIFENDDTALAGITTTAKNGLKVRQD